MNFHQSRRTFFLGSTALALSSFVLSSRNAVAQEQFSFENPLSIPSLENGTIVSGVRVFDLKLQNGKIEFFKGLETDTSGINGSYLGPILRMRTGESVRMLVANELGRASTLHWHGMNVPAKADGGPYQSIPSGETWSPEFTVKNGASTMWYHSHQVNETGSQVWAGLAGMIIIDDDVSDKLNLPSTYGVDDLPLVLQDRRFNSDGSMPYDITMHDEMMGMQGNVPLINGTVLPYFKVSSEKLRIRLLNGSNASIYNLAFADGRAFSQIASDGGLLAEPVTMTGLRLAPGERAEIVVDFGPNQTVLLQSVAGNVRAGRGMGQGMGMMMGAQSPEFDLIEFRTTTELKPTAAVPAKLANLPDVSASDAVRTRKFLLEMSGMGPMRMLGMGGTFTINGNGMNMERIDEVVKMGETEIWQITNAGPMIHPFHIHNTQFRILDRDGRPPSANESGLKDTVVINPDETVQLLVQFDNHADAERPYMFHCHILEHEDAGMMGQFTVV